MEETHFGVPVSLRYHRSTLSKRHQDVIDRLARAVEQYQESIILPSDLKVYDADMRLISRAFELDYPEVWWTVPTNYSMQGGIVVRVNFKPFDQQFVRQAHATILEVVERFKRTLKQRSTMEPYDIVRCIHDFIVLYCDYSESGTGSTNLDYRHTIYGFFTLGCGVCEGYTETFLFLCYQYGIPALKVVGLGNGSRHSWNMVQINGAWYHADLTWDDPMGQAKSAKTAQRFCSHLYMNVSDEYIKLEHKIDSEFQYPSATSMDFNYHVVSDSFLAPGLSDHDLIEAVARGCIKYLDSGYDQAEFLIDVRLRHQAVIEMVHENAYNILYYIRQNTDHEVALNSISFTGGQSNYPSFGFHFKMDPTISVYRGEPLQRFDQQEVQQMATAIADAVNSGKTSVLFSFNPTQPFQASMDRFNGVVFNALRMASERCTRGILLADSFNYSTNADRHAYCLIMKVSS